MSLAPPPGFLPTCVLAFLLGGLAEVLLQGVTENLADTFLFFLGKFYQRCENPMLDLDAFYFLGHI